MTNLLRCLARPKKAIGLESPIGSWWALSPSPLLAKLPEPKASNHRIMKPSSGNHQRGWSRSNMRRAQGGQGRNSSRTETGLDARDNIHLPSEGMGEIFFLTSPLIGQLTVVPKGSQSGKTPVIRQLLCSALCSSLVHDRVERRHRVSTKDLIVVWVWCERARAGHAGVMPVERRGQVNLMRLVCCRRN